MANGTWRESFVDPTQAIMDQQKAATQATTQSVPAATGSWRESFSDPSMMLQGQPQIQFGQGDRSAGMGALVRAGFIDDPATKIRMFAEQRGISPERYRVIDGQIYYQAADGQFYPESPAGAIGAAKEFAAGLVSDIPGIVLGTAGAVGGGTGGMAVGGPAGATAGAILGGGAGSAAGEAIRQEIATQVFGQPRDFDAYKRQLAEAFAIGTVSEAGGKLIGRGIQAFKERRAVSDIAKLNQTAVDRLSQLADQQGIQLTPGEVTGLKSLINQQWLLSNLPNSSDTIESFLKNRNADIQKAMYGFFDTLSANASPYEGFLKGARSVDARLATLKTARRDASEQFYKAAYPELVPDDVAADLAADPLVAQALKTVQSKPVWKRNMKGPLEEVRAQNANVVAGIQDPAEAAKAMSQVTNKALGWYDLAKRQLNDKAESLRRAGNNAEAAQYEQAAQGLVEKLDTFSETYKQARTEFARLSEPINKLEDSLVGGFVKADSQQAQELGRTLFGAKSSPEALREAKSIIQAADPAGWNNVVRAHLQDVLERTVRESQVGTVQNLGGIYRSKLFGTEQQRKLLKEALDSTQFQALRDMMEVLEATSKSFKGQSITVPGGYIAKDLQADSLASAGLGTKAAKAVAGLTQPLNWPQMLDNAINDIRLGRYSEELAGIITSPDAIKKLRENTLLLRQMSPRERATSPTVARIIGQMIQGPAPTETRPEEEPPAITVTRGQ